MKTLVLTITLLAGALATAIAQGKKSIVIGTMIDRPNAVLVINPPNKDQGFLLPQLTSTERLGIAPTSPQDNGLVVYDVTDNSFYYWSTGSWIKGLGDNTNQSLTYDAATQALSLSGGGGTISLSTLKEVPSTTGQAGKYLTTDGTTLTWVSLGTLGDITSIIAGQGLTGGATSGDINLSVNTDGTTISVNGSNQLQLSNGAVTNTKLAANAVNSSNISDGTITGTDISDNTISTNDLINASVTGPKIANGAVGTTQINSGGNNKVLSTDGTGVVTWVDRSTFNDDNQNLTLAGNTLNIDNGTAANLNNLTAAGDVAGSLSALAIQPGSVNSAKIQDGSVATTDLTTGGNNKVLTTDGTGLVNWADRSTFVDDNQNLTLAGNTLNIDNGTAANLNNLAAAGEVAGPLNALVIQSDAVNSAKILNSSIATADIASGGVNKVLTTDGAGLVSWTDQSLLTAPAAIEFYAVDPANFQPMEPSNGTTTLGLFTSGGASYVFAKGNSRQIVAAVNLPHGATVQSITVYYEYTLLIGLGPINVNFDRKLLGGGNQVLSTVSPLLALGSSTIAMPGIPGPNNVIDNSTYTYRVHVTFNNLLDSNDANALSRLYGIRIQYSK